MGMYTSNSLDLKTCRDTKMLDVKRFVMGALAPLLGPLYL